MANMLAHTSSIVFKGKIKHRIAGRIRLHYRGLRYLQGHFSELSGILCALPGVRFASINKVTETILLVFRPGVKENPDIVQAVDFALAKYALEAYKQMRAEHKAMEPAAEKKTTSSHLLKRLAISGGTIALSKTLLKNQAQFELIPVPYLGKLTTFPALISLGLSAPMLKSAWEGLVKEKRLNADFLTVTSIVASLLLGQSFSALTIIALSDMAEFMTAYTIERTRKSIKDLLSVDEDFAWKLMESGELVRFTVKEVQKGDTVAIHTGEKVVVDGVVLSGQALVDQSHTTGEFLPVVKKKDDTVYAGAIIKSGTITVRAASVGDETVVSRIIDMVENAAAQQAPIQHYADRFSNYLVPLNFIAAVVIGLVTRSPEHALKMLVIDYSCGIKLSTATAFSAAINSAVKQGILIKGGAFIEQMSGADTVIFDKTGTITEGRPQIVAMKLFKKDYTEKRVIALACAAEETSAHPLASAILAYGVQMGVEIPVHGETITAIAKGSQTTVDGRAVLAGSLAYMKESDVTLPPSADQPVDIGIATYVAEDGKLLGVLYAVDQPRNNIRRSVNSLRQKGVNEILLLTGDNKKQAEIAAGAIGADRFMAEMLPEQKAEVLLKTQSEGHRVVMVGDGINDAPALAYANVGISLGNKSTDVAMETSDIIIGRNDPMLIPQVMDLSQQTMEIIKQNFAMVVGINSVGLILGAVSNISVFVSALLHNMSTIAVVGNSCRLLLYGYKKGDEDEAI